MAHTTRDSLFVRLRDGESVAWDEFHARYRPLIAWAAARCDAGRADVDDVVQEVMLDLFRGQATFRYDRARGRFRDYLFVVTRRKAAQARTRRARGGVVTDAVPEPAADDTLTAEWEAEWQRAVLREALEVVRGEVEEATFRAFVRFGMEGQPVDQVAAELGIAPASVYVYKKRVVQRLRAVAEELAER